MISKSAADQQGFGPAALDAPPSVVACWDHQPRFLYANRACAAWLRAALSGILGLGLHQVWDKDVFPWHQSAAPAVLASQPQDIKCTMQGQDGVTRHCLASYSLITNDGEFAGVILQVVEGGPLQHAEVALHCEAALEQAQRLGQTGSWEW